MSFAEALRDLESAHEEELEDEYERGRETGWNDGFADGRESAKGEADALVRALLSVLAQRRVRSELPLLRDEAMMSLDEVEAMIREAR